MYYNVKYSYCATLIWSVIPVIIIAFSSMAIQWRNHFKSEVTIKCVDTGWMFRLAWQTASVERALELDWIASTEGIIIQVPSRLVSVNKSCGVIQKRTFSSYYQTRNEFRCDKNKCTRSTSIKFAVPSFDFRFKWNSLWKQVHETCSKCEGELMSASPLSQIWKMFSI